MVDRRLVFGDPADAGTRWAMDDAAGAAGGGNFVIARDLDGAGVLLRYNPTSGNFEYFGDVDLGGRSIQNGATTVFDGATDTVGDGTTSANHESVKTVRTDIGSTRFAEEVATFDTGGTTADIDVPFVGQNGRTALTIEFDFQAGGTTTGLLLRANGDGNSTGNYTWEDASGSRTFSANEIPLATTSGVGMMVKGEIEIVSTAKGAFRFHTMYRVGIDEDVAHLGWRDVNNSPVSSVQLIPDGSASELRGRVLAREVAP